MTDETDRNSRQPRLHILKLHESPVQGDDYERFSQKWLMDDSKSPEIMVPGDLLLFPELLTGAGEFEGMRFVGPRDGDRNHLLTVLNGGIEYPEFPTFIFSTYAADRSLRRLYAGVMDCMLRKLESGPESLEDIMGGDEPLDEFWNEPASLRDAATDGEWVIPLDQCTLQESVSNPGGG